MVGRHVTHGIHKEQAAHSPPASLGSSTVEYHRLGEVQSQYEKSVRGKTHTHSLTHTHKEGGMFLHSSAAFQKGPEWELRLQTGRDHDEPGKGREAPRCPRPSSQPGL